MKHLLTIVALVVCSSLSVSASAPPTVPLPQSRPFDDRWAQTQPDPRFLFPDRTQAQATPTPSVPAQPNPPATVQPGGSPIVVAAPQPSGLSDILAAVQAAFAALIAAFLGKLAFKPPGQAPVAGGTVSATPTDVRTIVSSIFSPGGTSIISDPAIRAAVDNALLQIVQSGVPGAAITTGAGMVPGAAPIVSILEPMLRKVVVSELTARASGSVDPTATVAVPATALSGIEALLKDIAGKFPKPV